jgi:hypothetical protein
MDVLGLPQGPEVGKILGQLLETVIDHPEWNTEAGLEALLKGMTNKDLSSIPKPDNRRG